MARRKDDDNLFELIFRLTPWWASLLIVAASYVVLRFIVPLFLGTHSPWTLLFVVYAPYVALLMALYVAVAEAAKFQRRRLLDQQTSLDDIRRMPWQQFERLVGEAYRRKGYAVEEVGGGGPDGGVDLILRRGGETTLVQCKRWKDKRVGAPTVRELRGAVARDRATCGLFVTSGTFTNEARAESQGQPPLELVDGAALLELVKEVQSPGASTPEARPPAVVKVPPPAIPAAVPASIPGCPACQRPMLLREARRGQNAGGQFWGCPAYPQCRGTRQV